MNLEMPDTGSLFHSVAAFVQANFAAIVFTLVIILGCLILQKASARVLNGLARRLARGPAGDGRNRIAEALKRPLEMLIMLAGLYAALNLFPISPVIAGTALPVFRSILAVLVLWWLYNLTNIQEGYFKYLFEERFQVDPALIPVFLNFLRVFIVACGIVLIAGEWGYDLNAFVAGLGLGGLALALAAKETLANLFGGIIILTEKPFRIGDWVQTSNVEGTVEEIGFRSCRFRTAAQALVTVPNYPLTNEAITNWSRIGKKQIAFQLHLALSTPAETMKAVVSGIEGMLQNHEGIHPEAIMVNFETLGGRSLDVKINCFTVATELREHLAVREDVNYRILAIIDEAGAEFMLPAAAERLIALIAPEPAGAGS